MNIFVGTNNYRNLRYLLRYYFFKTVPKFFYYIVLGYKYKKKFNNKLNLKNPVKLSEKIQWLKLNDNNFDKTLLSDKLSAKKYINNIIPDLKYAKVYQECNLFKELDFSKLPETFALKTNHAWKTNIFIRNKSALTFENMKQLEKYYNAALKIDYAYWSYYELQYHNITPKIYAEEFLYNNVDLKLIEYEVYCINGEPEFIKTAYLIKDIGCYSYKFSFCDNNYNKIEFAIDSVLKNNDIKKTKNADKILEYSRILSKKFKFVRIDFMEVKNELYFGEMTFTPYSGFIKFVPEEYDLIIGKKLKL